MASTTSYTGDTSSEQQQAQRKQKYKKRKRPVYQTITVILQEKKEKQLLVLHVIFLYSPTRTRRLTPSVAVGDLEGT